MSLLDTSVLSFFWLFFSKKEQNLELFIDWKSRCYTTWQTEHINLSTTSSCRDGGPRISDVMSQQFFTICLYSVDASDGECACFMYNCIINSMQMLWGRNVALLSRWISYPDALKHFSYKPHGRMILFSFNSWGFFTSGEGTFWQCILCFAIIIIDHERWGRSSMRWCGERKYRGKEAYKLY